MYMDNKIKEHELEFIQGDTVVSVHNSFSYIRMTICLKSDYRDLILQQTC